MFISMFIKFIHEFILVLIWKHLKYVKTKEKYKIKIKNSSQQCCDNNTYMKNQRPFL